MGPLPAVSVIIPCYNEQATIRLLLEALHQQTFPLEKMEVLVVDGGSSDATRQQIAAFQEAQPALQVSVIDNPSRTIPAALNRGIAAARGPIIVRLDAHSKPYPDYVARCVADLEQGLGDNVGGVWDIQPGAAGPMAQAIAAAACHPLGVGDARYRYTTQAGTVDTVPFGAFFRSLVERVGGYDEGLLTNEDYEFNTRIRQAGGKIWLDPAIRSVYFARATLGALAHQYWRYGFWKARMLRRYPGTLRWRQALPPAFVAGLLGTALLALFWPLARVVFLAEWGLYAAVLLAVGIQATYRQKQVALLWGMPPAMAVMHLTWGAALLWSLLRPASQGHPSNRS